MSALFIHQASSCIMFTFHTARILHEWISISPRSPVAIAAVAFPVVAVVRTQAQHGEAIRGIHEYLQGVPIEAENASLRVGSVQESLRQDQRELRKLQSSSPFNSDSPIDTVVLGIMYYFVWKLVGIKKTEHPQNGSQRNKDPGALLHNNIAQDMR
ncbi:hypothetical protein Tco_0695027 [Tanacetum coccineum]